MLLFLTVSVMSNWKSAKFGEWDKH